MQGQYYYATLRGGMCSSYLAAAAVIASSTVATSKTGAMGTVRVFVHEACRCSGRMSACRVRTREVVSFIGKLNVLQKCVHAGQGCSLKKQSVALV